MKRYLKNSVLSLALSRHKMAFISGPRQVGKTTLAKSYKSEFKEFVYRNWDETNFRRIWLKSPNEAIQGLHLEKLLDSKVLILDEIHKSKNWKQKVKGLYDSVGDRVSIVVTGSARLNVFKRGGDSLMGRYLNFRLHPITHGELSNDRMIDPESWKKSLFVKPRNTMSNKSIDLLLKYSGFPEPLLAKSDKIHNIWQRSRVEKIIREDLRDISRIPELSRVEMLAALLPTKVGSPLSIQSLREDLEASHEVVKGWVQYLNILYYHFELKPWSKSLPRALKKEPKIYLHDWTEVTNEAVRFENLVASHLLKACHYWTDTGEGNYEIYYLRNKDKQEIDFLITQNKKPWLCIEVKKKEAQINHKVVSKFTDHLKCPYVQVVYPEGVWENQKGNFVMSAGYLFKNLP